MFIRRIAILIGVVAMQACASRTFSYTLGLNHLPVFFQSQDVAELSLETDFDQLFAKKDEEFKLPGKLKIADEVIDVNVSVRGNTSLAVCRFPKLEIKIKGESSNFKGLDKLKIGTHCDIDPLKPDALGRLGTEASVRREWQAYKAYELIGKPAHGSRLVNITYGFANGTKVKRQAFMFEHIQDVAKRMNAIAINTSSEGMFEDPKSIEGVIFDKETFVAVEMLEALVGNLDWEMLGSAKSAVLDAGRESWNIRFVKRANKMFLPIPNDFDLADIVRHKDDTTAELKKELEGDALFNSVFGHLTPLRVSFPKSIVVPVIKLYQDRKNLMLTLPSLSVLEKSEKDYLIKRMQAFYKVLERFYDIPLININAVPNTDGRLGLAMFETETATQHRCRVHALFAPVKILERKPKRILVEILSTQESTVRCDTVLLTRKGWIEKRAVCEDACTP